MSLSEPHLLTIVALNYLPRAAVLIEDFRRHHPAGEATVVLSDRRVAVDGLDRLGARVRWADELGLSNLHDLAFRYDVREFATAIKAQAVRLLLSEGDRPVVYLDPDIRIFARLDAAGQMLADGAEMVLTPHILRPLDRALTPRDIDILRAGCFNLGFLAVRAAPDVDRFLAWCAIMSERHAFADPTRGAMCDQRFYDLAPAFVERLAILRDPAWNVAYWNLGQRRLEAAGGRIAVDGRPLVFFHYSGFDERTPQRLSRFYAGSVETADTRILGRLLRDYAARLARSPLSDLADRPYGFAAFADGTPVPAGLRRLYADRIQPFAGDPFRDLPALLVAEDGEGLTGLMRHAAGWRPIQAIGLRIDGTAARARFRERFPAIARRLDLVAP